MHPSQVPQKPSFLVTLNEWTWIPNASCSSWINNVMYKDFTTTTSRSATRGATEQLLLRHYSRNYDHFAPLPIISAGCSPDHVTDVETTSLTQYTMRVVEWFFFLRVSSGSHKIHKILQPFSVVNVRGSQVFQAVRRAEDVTIEDYMIGGLLLSATDAFGLIDETEVYSRPI